MRRLVLTGLFLSLLILNGCIVSTSPLNPIVSMDKGDTLDFSVVVFPASSNVLWTLSFKFEEVDTANGLNYSFTPEQEGRYTMKLEVSEPEQSPKSRTWVIFVQ